MEFSSLDDNALQEVFWRCQTKDLPSIMLSCKRFNDIIANSTLIWSRRLAVDFRLRTRLVQGVSNFNFYKFSSKMHLMFRNIKPEFIRFKGFFTNGGVDSGNLSYWVDNAFKPEKSPYCSERSSNVDCIGVLLDLELEEKDKEEKLRKYLRRRCKYAAALLEQVHQTERVREQDLLATVETYSDLQLVTFFLSLCDAMEERQPLGELLFYDVPSGDVSEQRRMALAVRETLYQSKQSLQSVVSNFGQHILMDTSLINALSASRNIAFIREFEISRAGQLTCPVSCGLLFAASVCTSEFEGTASSNFCEKLQNSIEQSNISVFNSVDTFESICKMSTEGTLPSLSKVSIQQGGCFVEFGTNPDIKFNKKESEIEWKPISWFQFHDYNQHESIHIDTIFEQALSVMQKFQIQNGTLIDRNGPNSQSNDPSMIRAELRRPISVNFLGIKLITQENFMEEMSDPHHWPNIDVTALRAFGWVLTLPTEIALK